MHQCTTTYNSLYSIAKLVAELKNTLHFESEAIINWFKNSKMIFNPEKFQVIKLDKRIRDKSTETIKFVIKQLRPYL